MIVNLCSLGIMASLYVDYRLSLPSKEKQKAVVTGTDNKPVDGVQNRHL